MAYPGCPKLVGFVADRDGGPQGVFDADVVDQARRGKPCGNGPRNEETNFKVGLGNYVSKFILARCLVGGYKITE